MDILDYHDQNYRNEDYGVLRINWLIKLFNFIIKNKNRNGYPVEVWKTKVINNTEDLNEVQLEFINLSFCYRQRLELALKALGCVMLYLFNFQNRKVFEESGFKGYPENLPNFNSQKVSDKNLTDIYRLLMSGKAEFKNKSINRLLEESLLFIEKEKKDSLLLLRFYQDKMDKQSVLDFDKKVSIADFKKTGLGYGNISDQKVEDIRYWQKYFFTKDRLLKIFGKVDVRLEYPNLIQDLDPKKDGLRIQSGDVFVDFSSSVEEISLILALGYTNELVSWDKEKGSSVSVGNQDVLVVMVVDLSVIKSNSYYFVYPLDNHFDLEIQIVSNFLWLNLQGKLFYQPEINDLTQATWIYNNVSDWAELQKQEARKYLLETFDSLAILEVFEIFKSIQGSDEFKLRCYLRLKRFIEKLTVKDELLIRKIEADLIRLERKPGNLFLELFYDVRAKMSILKMI